MPGKKLFSLKKRLISIMLICWILPLLLNTAIISFIVVHNIDLQTIQAASGTTFSSARVCTTRINAAASASRLATYYETIAKAYRSYKSDYLGFRQSVRTFLEQSYRFDEKFKTTSLYFYGEQPLEDDFYIFNESLSQDKTLGEAYDLYKKTDLDKIVSHARNLDTKIGFQNSEDRIYMYRNLFLSTPSAASSPDAILIMQLNTSLWFDSMKNTPWGRHTCLLLDNQPIKSEEIDFDALYVLERFKAENGQSYGSIKAEGQNFLVGEIEEADYTFAYVVQVDNSVLMESVGDLQYGIFIISLLVIPFLIFALSFFTKSISHPVKKLVEGSDKIKNGEFGLALEDKFQSVEFKNLADSFNAMSAQLRNQFDKIYREELDLRDAKIMALQSQINPHFLGNTLEIINWEARLGDSARVSRMLEALSVMLGAAMDRKSQPLVPLSEEMMYVDAYLYIIGERFGPRLSVKKELDQSLLGLTVPRLILQPIIENAVEHGVSSRSHGEIIIRAYRRDALLLLEIENSGALSDSDKKRIDDIISSEADISGEGSLRLGIKNTSERLKIIYGAKAGLSIEPASPEATLSRLIIPIEYIKNKL
ncbi:MAG: histidine kinase [Oscillospiraceae bacterium]|nr:histidine kinase [Oscillospiraceae bacterium]